MTDDFKTDGAEAARDSVPEASKPSKSAKKAPAKKRKAAPVTKPTGYVVAEGKALTSLSGRGVLGPGDKVTTEDVGGDDRLKSLADAGYLKGV